MEQIIYTNSDGVSVNFSTASKYRVHIPTQVRGLGMPSTTRYRESVVDTDGSVETGYHVEDRPITITGKIFENNKLGWPTLRINLQSALTPHRNGTLKYKNGTDTYLIDVRIEDCVIDVGQNGDYPTFSISLTAPFPHWRAETETTVTLTPSTTVVYAGNVACGAVFTFTASDTVALASLAITNAGVTNTVVFRSALSLVANDVLEVSTVPGSISVKINDVMAFEYIDFVASAIEKTLLNPGSNVIVWAAGGNEANLSTDMRYTSLYLGV